MGRELKRVPLDFNYPLKTVWKGYSPNIETFQKLFGDKYPFLYRYESSREICRKCEINNGECSEIAEYCLWYNKENKSKWFKEVPTGEGFQLWETTSEGSPLSPVFKTFEDLCEWCADNATIFAGKKISKKEWMDSMDNDFVYHKQEKINELIKEINYLYYREVDDPQRLNYEIESVRKDSINSRIISARRIKSLCKDLSKEEILELITLGYR